MKFLFKSVFTFSILFLANTAYSATLIGQEPSSDAIYKAGNGLEWVWASPCGIGGCSTVSFIMVFA